MCAGVLTSGNTALEPFSVSDNYYCTGIAIYCILVFTVIRFIACVDILNSYLIIILFDVML